MKHKKKAPKTDLETIMPLLIERWRKFRGIGGPNDHLLTREFRSVVKAVETLEQTFYGKDPVTEDYFKQRELLGAYLLYYWVMHYQEALSLIGELPTAPRRVLDVCSGAAPYAFAALQHGAEEVFALDRNENALALGAEVCGRYGKTLSIRKWNCHDLMPPVRGKFDLIILSHSLNELFPDNEKGWKARQEEFIDTLFSYLTEDGYLLLVENSLTPANHRLLELRDALVKKNVPVQAPCVYQGECPAIKVKNSPCYAQRDFERPFLVKEIQRSARIKQSSLKMSYVIFRHPKAHWPKFDDRNFYRVISPSIEIASGGNAFYLCGNDGKKKLFSDNKEHTKESRAFDYLKRGELITVEHPRVIKNTFEVVEDTKINIEAACGKSTADLEQH